LGLLLRQNIGQEYGWQEYSPNFRGKITPKGWGLRAKKIGVRWIRDKELAKKFGAKR
jgi:hypothetical protein